MQYEAHREDVIGLCDYIHAIFLKQKVMGESWTKSTSKIEKADFHSGKGISNVLPETINSNNIMEGKLQEKTDGTF